MDSSTNFAFSLENSSIHPDMHTKDTKNTTTMYNAGDMQVIYSYGSLIGFLEKVILLFPSNFCFRCDRPSVYGCKNTLPMYEPGSMLFFAAYC